jgi:hypothetical protein
MCPGLIIVERDGLDPDSMAELKCWAEAHGVLLVAKKPGALFELHPPLPCPGCPFQPDTARVKPPGYVA